jgi:hypothetical protein
MGILVRNGRAMVRRVDQNQRELVKDLETAGVRVWEIQEPCDLLTRFWCNRHHDFCWQPLEVKIPGARKRKHQETQNRFLEETQTPCVTDFDSAWKALNLRHSLSGIAINSPKLRKFSCV